MTEGVVYNTGMILYNALNHNRAIITSNELKELVENNEREIRE